MLLDYCHCLIPVLIHSEECLALEKTEQASAEIHAPISSSHAWLVVTFGQAAKNVVLLVELSLVAPVWDEKQRRP